VWYGQIAYWLGWCIVPRVSADRVQGLSEGRPPRCLRNPVQPVDHSLLALGRLRLCDP
jgi:hypothetical protein